MTDSKRFKAAVMTKYAVEWRATSASDTPQFWSNHGRRLWLRAIEEHNVDVVLCPDHKKIIVVLPLNKGSPLMPHSNDLYLKKDEYMPNKPCNPKNGFVILLDNFYAWLGLSDYATKRNHMNFGQHFRKKIEEGQNGWQLTEHGNTHVIQDKTLLIEKIGELVKSLYEHTHTELLPTGTIFRIPD